MRILYGVNGEGMGHATRSRVVIESLLADHDVRVVASGAAFAYLSDRLPRVDEVLGPSFAMEDGQIHRWATVIQNVRNVRKGVPDTVHNWVRVVDKTWRPEVVITDFEPLTGIYARTTRTPMIAVDNVNMLDRCHHDTEIVGIHREDFLLARAVIRSMVPGAIEYLVTTFFEAPIARGGTRLVPPIVRPEIESAVSERGEHLVVYSSGDPALIEALKASGVPCRVYGMRGGPEEDEIEGNLDHRPRSNEGFVEDLRTARAVVAGGGFSLLSEAVYLGKPVLSMPLHGQFEQLLNARYLEREGFGVCATEMSPEVLADFLGRMDEFEDALGGYEQEGNTVTLKTVEARAQAAVEAQPRELRRERRSARRRVK
jgi:uncharacterized protein (TIGR00661 family)